MILLLNIIFGVLVVYLFFSAAYPFMLSFFGLRRTMKWNNGDLHIEKTAILIPAYKEDAVIVDAVRQIIGTEPAKWNSEVIVIADQLKEETIKALWNLGVLVIPVSFKRSTKVKALKSAMSRLDWKAYTNVVILDADNELHPDFLPRILQKLDHGFVAAQGCRTPKNYDTGISMLDGLSEVANNHIYCKGPFNIGLSSRMSGSGMAFRWDYFRDLIQDMDAIGGFDKELELEITRRGNKIAYVEDAIVFDEKVRTGDNFSRQRSRWIAAQYQYLFAYAPLLLRQGILKGNIDFVHKVVNLALPPRLILPVAIITAILLGWILPVNVLFVYVLIAAFTLNMTTYLISWSRTDLKIEFKHVLSIFVAIWATKVAMTKLRAARKTFIHTVHGTQ